MHCTETYRQRREASGLRWWRETWTWNLDCHKSCHEIPIGPITCSGSSCWRPWGARCSWCSCWCRPGRRCPSSQSQGKPRRWRGWRYRQRGGGRRGGQGRRCRGRGSRSWRRGSLCKLGGPETVTDEITCTLLTDKKFWDLTIQIVIVRLFHFLSYCLFVFILVVCMLTSYLVDFLVECQFPCWFFCFHTGTWMQ